MTEEVAELVKAARYAQIDGDLKVAVVKLEQAMRLEPDNPVVLYYYGLTYEWLRNADKSREFFLKVYTQREKAGKYFARAAQHLQAGFSSPADLRGDMSFGTILEYRDPECPAGERVKLIVPILMKDGLNVRPEDLRVIVQFFDKVNGKRWKNARSGTLLAVRHGTCGLGGRRGNHGGDLLYAPPDGGGDDRLRKPQVLRLHRQIVLQG